jgi:predicted DNA-binding protein
VSKANGTASGGGVFRRSLRLRVTNGMYTRLVQLAGNERHVSAIVREAIRLYLDDQEDVRASRAHFTRSFRARLDHVDEAHVLLGWYLTVLLILVGQIGAAILNKLHGYDADDPARVSGPALVGNAIAVIERGGGSEVQRQIMQVVRGKAVQETEGGHK